MQFNVTSRKTEEQRSSPALNASQLKFSSDLRGRSVGNCCIMLPSAELG